MPSLWANAGRKWIESGRRESWPEAHALQPLLLLIAGNATVHIDLPLELPPRRLSEPTADVLYE